MRNADTDVGCDCGFDLVHGHAELERKRRVRVAGAAMAIGVAVSATAIAFGAGMSGTSLYVMYGVAMVGAALIGRGGMLHWRALMGADAERRQIDAWRRAMRLPSVDG